MYVPLYDDVDDNVDDALIEFVIELEVVIALSFNVVCVDLIVWAKVVLLDIVEFGWCKGMLVNEKLF